MSVLFAYNTTPLTPIDRLPRVGDHINGSQLRERPKLKDMIPPQLCANIPNPCACNTILRGDSICTTSVGSGKWRAWRSR